MTTATELFQQASGHPEPYPWQIELAEGGLPEALEVPTGCGKTLGVIVAWLWRRRYHPDASVRAATPRKLIFTLPMRTLVNQTREVATDCLDRLGLADDVSLVALMGGEPASDEWRLHPEREAIVICTLDMGLSGALNRAYGSSRFTWPVTFGVLNNDVHWVLDEVQLMGPAASTSRQLQAFRNAMGTSLRTSSTWMSATLGLDRLCTVDAPTIDPPFRLNPGEEPPALLRRLEAPRRFGRWVLDRPENPDKGSLARLRAEAIVATHRPGTRTIAVVNTVETARDLHTAMVKAGFADPILLHSRFRPTDRQAVLDRVLAEPPAEGSIVVSTQVIEAGVDLTSATLFTEVAPWSSLVQRAGRCNRTGEWAADLVVEDLPQVLWDPPRKPLPYEEAEIKASVAALEAIDGQVITTRSLAAMEVESPEPTETQVLRRRDLIRLFDTAPDLGGNDLDIGPYLRDGEDLDAFVCWRDLDEDGQPIDQTAPGRPELCPVSVGEVSAWLKESSQARVMQLDHLEAAKRRGRRHQWIPVGRNIRPGMILMADPRRGGYGAERGWDPKVKGPVPTVTSAPEQLAPIDETMGSDPASIPANEHPGRRTRTWVTLDQHLGDVERELVGLTGVLDLALPEETVRTLIEAGRWHDLGKAHHVFQDTLKRTAGDGEAPPADGPWAKSGGSKHTRHTRQHFRHELASALALMAEANEVLAPGVDADLAIYLVASHHGRVRLSIRSFPGEEDEAAEAGKAVALGIHDGDELPGGDFARCSVPTSTLSLDAMTLGGVERSWVERATSLRDRDDLGVFRLGHLEALLRVADWRVSASYDTEAT